VASVPTNHRIQSTGDAFASRSARKGGTACSVKAIKQSLGGTVNDVVLARAAGALRRLLEQRGETLDRPLRAMVPVNLRGEDHTSLGNQVTSLFVELPVGESDVRQRFEQTRAAATAR